MRRLPANICEHTPPAVARSELILAHVDVLRDKRRCPLFLEKSGYAHCCSPRISMDEVI